MEFKDCNLKQFIIYRLARRNNKIEKIPCSPLTGLPISVKDSEQWVTFSEAENASRHWRADGVGFVIVPPYWFLDIDHCLLDTGAWSPLAIELCTQFNGAYLEVSQSGRGLHLFGRGQASEHKCKNIEKNLEFYTEARFAALTGMHARGDIEFDATALLPALIDKYFTPSSAVFSEWSQASGAHPSWSGPADDEELISLMLNSRSSQFRRGATIQQLWTADEKALTEAYPPHENQVYDASSADAALAQHLGFWTGNDVERMIRLMYRSQLVREKWQQRVDYLPRTIESARAKQTTFYQGSALAKSQSNVSEIGGSDSLIEVNITDIFTNPPRPPDFIIESILPRGVLTLCSGHGGSGKSFLALQAAVCIATGRPFMGKQVKQGRVVFYSAEDSSEIVKHRLYRLCRTLEIDLTVLSANLKILDATNDPVLYQESSNNGIKPGSVTPVYKRLNFYVEQFSPAVIIIDNASDTFDANENERRYVRSFIRELVQLGKPYNSAILLIAHVAKQTARGLSNAENYSGSTAWHNSARSRLFLTVKDEILVLEHQKSNWGKCAEPIYLNWTADGLLAQVASSSEQDFRPLILNLIHKHYQRKNYISTKPNSSTGTPFKILSLDPAFPRATMTREKLATLFTKLEDDGLLEREDYQKNRKPFQRYKVKVAPTAPTSDSELSAVSTNTTPCGVLTTAGGVGERAHAHI